MGTENEEKERVSAETSPRTIYGPNPFAQKDFDHPVTTIVREFVPTNLTLTKRSPTDDVGSLPWECKAAEVETRELQQKEAQLQPRNNMSIPLKNWPPFFPLIYHDIEAELPGNCQDIAKRSYFIWQLTTGAYALNLIATIMMLLSGVPGYSSLSGTMFAAIYMVLFPAAAFFTWHYSLYKALKFDSSFWFIVYFVTFGIQMLFYGFLAIGLFNGGGGGILGMLEMFGHGKFVAGILSAICTAAMGLCLFMGIVLIKRVNDHFRNTGHSMGRAGAEAGRNISHNETVRRSAKDAVMNSV